MKPTVGSLFAGIGGFDLGFERAGFETVWQVEIDPWCRRVLGKNFPRAERYADITERFLWDDEACRPIHHDLQPVDVVCAGFPCQDISNAGLRAGIDGRRSGLWSHVVRLLPDLRPRFVLLENVAALLGRGLARVLGDLAEIGYDAEWEIVSAADVGAPHLRERVWILAYAAGSIGHTGANRTGRQAWADVGRSCTRSAMANTSSRRLREPQARQMEQSWRAEALGGGFAVANTSRSGFESECLSARPRTEGKRTTDAHGCSADVADTDSDYRHGRSSDVQVGWSGVAGEVEDDGFTGRTQWRVEPNVGRVAHGVPARVDRLRGLGNAVVPQIPELYARALYPLVMAARERAA